MSSPIPAYAAPSTPATRAQACVPLAELAASARAELLDLSLLDINLLGLSLPTVAAAQIGLAQAEMDPNRRQPSSASAQYADANLLGIGLPRSQAGPGQVAAQAPPTAQDPERLHTVELDLGLARVGIGELAAQAGWDDQFGCDAEHDEVTSAATSALADVAVLPGTGSALLAVSHQLTSRAATGLRADASGRHSAAYAEIGLAELILLGGIRVAVISPPQLQVLAAGLPDAAVATYTAPVLEISGDGIPTQRLSSAGESVELTLPVLGNVLGQDGSLLRLTLGELEREIGAQTVTAAATSVHLELVSLADSNTVLDLNIGRLHASASAPIQIPAGQGGCGEGCEELPVTTGPLVGLVAGTGALVLIAGRFLLLAARRRAGPAHSLPR